MLHFILSSSSWLDLIERWFAEAPKRGSLIRRADLARC